MMSQIAELRQIIEQRKRELDDASYAPDRHPIKNAKQIAADHTQERRAAFLAAIKPTAENAEVCELALDLIEYINTHIARTKWSEHLSPVCFEMSRDSPAARSCHQVSALADVALKCVGLALQLRITLDGYGGRKFFWMVYALPAVEVAEDFRTPAFDNLSATLVNELKNHWIDMRIRAIVGRLLKVAKKHPSRQTFTVPGDECDLVITDELEQRLWDQQIECRVDDKFVSQPAPKPRDAPPRAQSRIIGEVGIPNPAKLYITFEFDE